MVIKNNKLNGSYWTYPYLAYVLLTQICVCSQMCVIDFYKYHTYFYNERILHPFMRISLVSLG